MDKIFNLSYTKLRGRYRARVNMSYEIITKTWRRIEMKQKKAYSPIIIYYE